MILAALVAASLVIPISIDPAMQSMLSPGTTMPAELKEAAVRPLVSTATECIARTVSADPRFRAFKSGVELNNLIVESVPACVDALRAMIDTYDRMYGDGAGQTYFMGPYLDGLPDAVSKRVKALR